MLTLSLQILQSGIKRGNLGLGKRHSFGWELVRMDWGHYPLQERFGMALAS